MRAKFWRVTMRHDHGTITMKLMASSAENARLVACNYEGAPERSVVKVEEVED